MNEPALMTAEYWRTHQCPWCGSAGMFMHRVASELLECDACGVLWSPGHVGRRLAEIMGSFTTYVASSGVVYGAAMPQQS